MTDINFKERQEEQQYIKMTQTPVSRLVITLGIPTTITMLVTSFYNLADTFFVSRINTSASGATGIVFGLMAIFQAVGFMFGHGSGSIISRYLGAKDRDSATKYASTSFFLALFSGIIMGVAGLIFCRTLMILLGSTDTILPYAMAYGKFVLFAAPAMTAGCVLNNILRYEGRAALAMIGLVSGAAINIVLDPILIFAFNMGTAGAGLATAASQYISMFILLGIFLTGRTQCEIGITYFSRGISDSLLIIKTGIPSLIRQGLTSVAAMMLNRSAAVHGGDAAIAAMSIVSRISYMIFCVGLGIGQGYQPVAGFNYGAGKYSRVKKGLIFTLFFGTATLSVFSICGLVASEWIIGAFRDDADVIQIGTFALYAQCIALIFVPTCVCGNMLFQSTGMYVRAGILSALRNGICFIPLIVILPEIIGITGIQLAQPIADVVSAAVTVPFLIVFFRKLPQDI